jgi:hypothetical protein
MNQGHRWVRFMKNSSGKKSRATVPLSILQTVSEVILFFGLYRRSFKYIASDAPQRTACGAVPSQVAAYLGIDNST